MIPILLTIGQGLLVAIAALGTIAVYGAGIKFGFWSMEKLTNQLDKKIAVMKIKREIKAYRKANPEYENVEDQQLYNIMNAEKAGNREPIQAPEPTKTAATVMAVADEPADAQPEPRVPGFRPIGTTQPSANLQLAN